VGSVKKAYDANRGPKVLVRYENLRMETLEIMERIYFTLKTPLDERRRLRAGEALAGEYVRGGEEGRRVLP